MEQFNFYTNSKEERNDVVFDKTFNLLDNPYRISIKPKVKFWRLGLRLSSVPSIAFPSISRHAHGIETSVDLQVAVGVLNEQKKEWHTPNKIEFSWYDKNGMLSKLAEGMDYIDNSVVELMIRYDQDLKKTITSLSYGGFVSTDFEINISAFTNFKVFAWAEYEPFEIDCSIDIFYDDAPVGNIVFLGMPGVGKTSLISRIAFDSFNGILQATKGLNITEFRVESSSQDRRLLTMLDFGGQEIFASISNIFLAKKISM